MTITVALTLGYVDASRYPGSKKKQDSPYVYFSIYYAADSAAADKDGLEALLADEPSFQDFKKQLHEANPNMPVTARKVRPLGVLGTFTDLIKQAHHHILGCKGLSS